MLEKWRSRVAVVALLWLAGGVVPAAAQESPAIRLSLPADYAPLQKAVLLSIGENIFRTSEMGTGSHPIFRSGLPRGTIQEHAALVGLLRGQSVEVLDVRDLLSSAVAEARRQGKLAAWLKEIFPVTAEKAIQHLDEIDGASILNLREEHFYLTTGEGLLDPLFPGMSSMYWSRDFAATTPRGIVIGNSQHYGRVLERELARLMFGFAPELANFPVAFDAGKEGVFLDGGDLIVKDEQTLLLGVGNRSTREAAERLAVKLGLDVLAVALPDSSRPTGLRGQLLHLDSIFNIVDRRTVLAIPYFLEQEEADRNPMREVLLGVARQLGELSRLQPEYRLGDPSAIEETVKQMSQIGWVTRFKAGTGEAEPLGLKLVDYFRSQGYRVVYVGGEPAPDEPARHALERAMYELRWQGANVVQLAPGRVVAYQHNIHTNQALRDAGLEVLTFPGELLSMRNGGPHCLVMPLVRGKLP